MKCPRCGWENTFTDSGDRGAAQDYHDRIECQRSYAVGVPLICTVFADGKVVFEVDLSEIEIEHDEHDEATIEADEAVLSEAASKIQNHYTLPVIVTGVNPTA